MSIQASLSIRSRRSGKTSRNGKKAAVKLRRPPVLLKRPRKVCNSLILQLIREQHYQQ